MLGAWRKQQPASPCDFLVAGEESLLGVMPNWDGGEEGQGRFKVLRRLVRARQCPPRLAIVDWAAAMLHTASETVRQVWRVREVLSHGKKTGDRPPS